MAKFYTVIQCSGWQGDSWRVAGTFDDKKKAEEFKNSKRQPDPKHDFYNVRIMPHNKKISDLSDPVSAKFSDGTVAALDYNYDHQAHRQA